jgi:serine/threonine-protein kinase RsbT
MPGNEFYVRVGGEMDVSRAVMQTKRCAEQWGFSADLATMIATAASELARNIVKYAEQGEIIIRRLDDGAHEGLEIEARDHGPGIEDVDLAMQDNVSNGGTLGLGLPGVRRMMDAFQIESVPGEGTRVVAVKWL